MQNLLPYTCRIWKAGRLNLSVSNSGGRRGVGITANILHLILIGKKNNLIQSCTVAALFFTLVLRKSSGISVVPPEALASLCGECCVMAADWEQLALRWGEPRFPAGRASIPGGV